MEGKIILGKLFNILFNLLEYLIFIDVILSWVYRGENSITRLIHAATEPILAPGRKIQERLMPQVPVDLSPILGLFIISLLQRVVNMFLGFL